MAVDLGALRQRLAALDYRGEIDDKSGELVHRLLGELPLQSDILCSAGSSSPAPYACR